MTKKGFSSNGRSIPRLKKSKLCRRGKTRFRCFDRLEDGPDRTKQRGNCLNKYHLKKNGVKIYYVAEAIPDTPEGIILDAVIEGMAAYYSEQLSQNVRRGMKTSAQKGRYTGGTCPLGYTITADKKYEVDPKYAPVVRDIFQLYSEGKTITEIVKILNDKGLRTSRGHAFTHNSLRTVLKNKKYIGTYEYNGEVSIENSVPPIVDVDVFNKVQDLLAFNHKAGAHKKAKVDYILFGKIFCGKCGAGMTGICGTSKQKVKHHYYICSAKKKKLCSKRAVRQDWIETLVLKHLLRLVRNEELLEFIAENTYQYFLAQNTDTTYTKSLQKALDETDRAINNLLRAIEAGIFNESTKDRMNELEEQKKDLRVALAAAKLKEDLALKKEHIVFFLHQFAGMDYSDIDCQKRLIKTFLNSVFVYDDKVVLTFNYSGDDRTITLHEIDGGLGHSICIPSCVVHHEKSDLHKQVAFFVMLCAGISLHPQQFCQNQAVPRLPLGQQAEDSAVLSFRRTGQILCHTAAGFVVAGFQQVGGRLSGGIPQLQRLFPASAKLGNAFQGRRIGYFPLVQLPRQLPLSSGQQPHQLAKAACQFHRCHAQTAQVHGRSLLLPLHNPLPDLLLPVRLIVFHTIRSLLPSV